jgi:hypothetical protein
MKKSSLLKSLFLSTSIFSLSSLAFAGGTDLIVTDEDITVLAQKGRAAFIEQKVNERKIEENEDKRNRKIEHELALFKIYVNQRLAASPDLPIDIQARHTDIARRLSAKWDAEPNPPQFNAGRHKAYLNIFLNGSVKEAKRIEKLIKQRPPKPSQIDLQLANQYRIALEGPNCQNPEAKRAHLKRVDGMLQKIRENEEALPRLQADLEAIKGRVTFYKQLIDEEGGKPSIYDQCDTLLKLTLYYERLSENYIRKSQRENNVQEKQRLENLGKAFQNECTKFANALDKLQQRTLEDIDYQIVVGKRKAEVRHVGLMAKDLQLQNRWSYNNDCRLGLGAINLHFTPLMGQRVKCLNPEYLYKDPFMPQAVQDVEEAYPNPVNGPEWNETIPQKIYQSVLYLLLPEANRGVISQIIGTFRHQENNDVIAINNQRFPSLYYDNMNKAAGVRSQGIDIPFVNSATFSQVTNGEFEFENVRAILSQLYGVLSTVHEGGYVDQGRFEVGRDLVSRARKRLKRVMDILLEQEKAQGHDNDEVAAAFAYTKAGLGLIQNSGRCIYGVSDGIADLEGGLVKTSGCTGVESGISTIFSLYVDSFCNKFGEFSPRDASKKQLHPQFVKQRTFFALPHSGTPKPNFYYLYQFGHLNEGSEWLRIMSPTSIVNTFLKGGRLTFQEQNYWGVNNAQPVSVDFEAFDAEKAITLVYEAYLRSLPKLKKGVYITYEQVVDFINRDLLLKGLFHKFQEAIEDGDLPESEFFGREVFTEHQLAEDFIKAHDELRVLLRDFREGIRNGNVIESNYFAVERIDDQRQAADFIHADDVLRPQLAQFQAGLRNGGAPNHQFFDRDIYDRTKVVFKPALYAHLNNHPSRKVIFKAALYAHLNEHPARRIVFKKALFEYILGRLGYLLNTRRDFGEQLNQATREQEAAVAERIRSLSGRFAAMPEPTIEEEESRMAPETVKLLKVKFDIDTLEFKMDLPNYISVTFGNSITGKTANANIRLERGFGLIGDDREVSLEQGAPLLKLTNHEKGLNVILQQIGDTLLINKCVGLNKVKIDSKFNVHFPGQLEEIPNFWVTSPSFTNYGTCTSPAMRFDVQELQNVGHLISRNPITMLRRGALVKNTCRLLAPFDGQMLRFEDDNFTFNSLSLNVVTPTTLDITLKNTNMNVERPSRFTIPRGSGIQWVDGGFKVLPGIPFITMQHDGKLLDLRLEPIDNSLSIVRCLGFSAFNLHHKGLVYYMGQHEDVPNLSISATQLINSGTLNSSGLTFNGPEILNHGVIASQNPLQLTMPGSVIDNLGKLNFPRVNGTSVVCKDADCDFNRLNLTIDSRGYATVSLQNDAKNVGNKFMGLLREGQGVRFQKGLFGVQEKSPFLEIVQGNKNVVFHFSTTTQTLSVNKCLGFGAILIDYPGTVVYPGQYEEMPPMTVKSGTFRNLGTLKTAQLTYQGAALDNQGDIISPNQLVLQNREARVMNNGRLLVPSINNLNQNNFFDFNCQYDRFVYDSTNPRFETVTFVNSKFNITKTHYLSRDHHDWGYKWTDGELRFTYKCPFIQIDQGDKKVHIGYSNGQLCIYKSQGFNSFEFKTSLNVMYPGQLEEIPNLVIHTPRLTNQGTLKATHFTFSGQTIQNDGHIISPNPFTIIGRGLNIYNKGLLKTPNVGQTAYVINQNGGRIEP